VRLKPDPHHQLVFFSALTLIICPVKIVPEITCNVSSRTLTLYTSSTTSYTNQIYCVLNESFVSLKVR